jgi:2-(1,2-epoxy-1,2-dihydrophenyl)acetyl-CoA isomerase
VTRADHVVTLRLNRPDALNALDRPTAEGLVANLILAHRDDDVDCIVITGTGRAFCAGGDMGSIARGASGSGEPGALDRLHDAAKLIADGNKPVLMAINGVAAGAGFGLALLGDVSVAVSTARFRPAFIALGASPDMGLAYTMPRLIGETKAREALFLNREFLADEALALGLVGQVVGADQFEAEVLALAQRLAAAPRSGFRHAKALLRQGRTRSFSEFLELELDAQGAAFKAPEIREGIAAFREKRSPNFRAARAAARKPV